MPDEEIKNASTTAAQNAAIKKAIDLFDFAQARALLREALPNAEGETFYLASLVALNDRQKRDFLQKAVAADPFHVEAFAALEQLTNPTTPQIAPPAPLTIPAIPPGPYAPPVLAAMVVPDALPLVAPAKPAVPTLSESPVLSTTETIRSEPETPSEAPSEPLSDTLSDSLERPTPPGGIAIQSLVQASGSVSVPHVNQDHSDKDYVKGIVQQDTPLYVIPDRNGSIRAQLLAFAEVILLARTDDSRWVNVIWLSSINKETIGWLPLSTIGNGYVQGDTVNLIDLPITKYEYNDTAHLMTLQSILQQEKWDQLRRSLNLIAILFGIAFCSFFLIDAAVGTRVPLDYLSISLGLVFIAGGFGRWWIGVGAIRQEWQQLDLIRHRKQATDEAVIAQQANAAALKLASEMVMSLLRNQ